VNHRVFVSVVGLTSLAILACQNEESGGAEPGAAGSPTRAGTAGSTGAGGIVVTAGGAGGVPSTGGTPAASGASGSAGTLGVGGTASAEFSLLFRDDFDSLDTGRWQLMTHSWSGNLAKFAANTVIVNGGFLTMTLLDAPPGTVDGGEAKSFLGAEVRSLATLTYGKVRSRLKFASGSAVVSAMVTIYTPWPADNWNELDIECLGADPTHVQFNTMVYTGALPAPSTPVAPTPDPYMHAFGFEASSDFHIQQMEWTPDAAVFSVDDVPVYTWSNRIELMNLPQNVLLTIWASSSAAWAGAVNGTTSGASAVVDWIELYQYTGN
jgi:endo-1,3-1,4-beta-glycanase ExoK